MMEQYIYGKIERTELLDKMTSSVTNSYVKER